MTTPSPDPTTGRMIPDGFEDQIVAMLRQANPFLAGLPPSPPLTRRQRIVGRFRGYRWRVSEAVAMLRGTHDCGDDW